MRGPRISPLLGFAIVSVVLLTAIIASLSSKSSPQRPLVAYVAASLRPAMEAIAADYEQLHGRRVELRFAGSENLLTQARLSAKSTPADLLLPADDSYLVKAREQQLIGDSFPIARMRGVVLVNEKQTITTWAELTAKGRKLALAEPSIAAIGLLTQRHLQATGHWAELDRVIVVKSDNVTQSANAVKLGAVDAAIVWDAVAVHYPESRTVHLPELDGITAMVRVAVLNQSPDPQIAAEFARFIVDPVRGLHHFRKEGFDILTPEGKPKP